ncbi:ammonium transporter [Rhodocaloribacter litoris]|uniref:ammonium transporter n=1 Tax=Rhodocaloribacter litoris TaxID=2558931 RepID=UPI0014242E34|nr:ammonium transporter [Rhodocaloribacter litoris]QXD14109.1 ammonium transporter [Rhodocaloribacter litoris]
MRRRFICLPALFFLGVPVARAQEAAAAISAPDTAWLLVSTALVLLMTPALAFFYGGLVRAKNALNTMMMSFIALGVAGVLWALLGYSLAFGSGTAWLGDLSMALLSGVGLEASGSIPHLLFMAFQGTFAIITVALISGAVVERMRFPAYVAFVGLWVLFVYAPVCHWVWGGGWLGELGALDFAGGAVVHINAGAAAVAAALFLGPRKDYGRQALLPHHVPFVLLGAGLLWFGWFGFNGGSALASNGTAGLAFVNTLLAPAATLVVWTALDHLRTGKITAVGVATAIVVGLVAVTPAAGFVSPLSALALGALAALPSYFAIQWRARTRFDDSLDVFAAHGLGGITGALLTGVFASAAWNGATDGLLFGNVAQFGIQALSVVAVFAYSGALTFAILKGLSLVMAVRTDDQAERLGLDIVHHGEEAYTDGEGALLLLDEETRPVRVPAPAVSPSMA